MNTKFELNYMEEAGEDFAQLDVIGELDSMNLRNNRTKFMDILSKHAKHFLVLNLLNMDFINSESISFLLQMEAELDKKGQKLIIINAKKNVQDVLNVIGIFETISYFPNLNEFIKNKS